ncbi:glycosyltransferase subunit STT3A [Seminavis robusta]|uniref:dolichyl-diphosphooligosaccharide--protein glycotransferase n=1 Tax=Seminavis robusta TaxID=568900 RepID=A0A9N8DWZ7_9STRA|nr:glycosyltransferase subunit STT3A [Seminavis robusta]|eukprot:Sro356_g125460.1 glycosyltransferase subunit STT3A (865) ;mRNA; r:62755-65664
MGSSSSGSSTVFGLFWTALAGYGVFIIAQIAYRIRLRAIEDFGPVIHEFDPYFNYRATEYLYAHGAEKFFAWFDHMVWYPLGRPVGTTIYPGMQFTAVWLKQYVLGDSMSLNDVCCYIPAWFGVVASVFVGLMAYEASLPINTQHNLLQWIVDAVQGKYRPVNTSASASSTASSGEYPWLSPSAKVGMISMAMMAIVPAHLTRSMGGGYDNESIAVSAMCSTFYCWMRAMRSTNGIASAAIWGILTGLAYFYMVAAWGGYIFVLNLIGLHAAFLVGIGRFVDRTYVAYSCFYVVGTYCAIQVPVVGWAPLKSLEQLGPCGVFLGYQVLEVCEIIRKKNKLSRKDAWKLRIQLGVGAGALGAVLIVALAPSGYFGPLSSRVRGLFVQHTRTGNPLVDSVAEHQPASTQAYFQYLHHVCTLAPVGFAMVATAYLSDTSSFILVWGTTSYFFSHKMVRLILLTGPIASICGGIAAGRIVHWAMHQLWWNDQPEGDNKTASSASSTAEEDAADDSKSKAKKNKKGQNATGRGGKSNKKGSKEDDFTKLYRSVGEIYKSETGRHLRQLAAGLLLLVGYFMASSFASYCWRLSKDLSNPSIIVLARLQDGRAIKLDDYRQAYWWLRDNTPEDARIMAWWDYGYQITAIANRTTLADGNTWNHEHIALLGMALTSPIEEGHEIARHLADYVLVWAGGGGDDVAKSPHLARIANSVYRDHCPDDPTCSDFGFRGKRGNSYVPSSTMEKSLLYKLHSHHREQGVVANPDLFQEVFTSKYGKVRIYKVLQVSEESRRWVADPKNKQCDVEGSWFCPGQYPPALVPILNQKKDFAQLEDFNRGTRDADEEYQQKYHEGLMKQKHPSKKMMKRAEL